MQTSFMHPPFGFALFYLRSVAARVPYLDKVTGKKIQPVTSGQIYWGAVPFVGIQILMIALTIMFPQMVMHYKGKPVNPSTIEMKMPDLPGLGGQGLSLPPLGAPPPLPQNGANAPQNSAPAQTAPQQPANPLSGPPKF